MTDSFHRIFEQLSKPTSPEWVAHMADPTGTICPIVECGYCHDMLACTYENCGICEDAAISGHFVDRTTGKIVKPKGMS